MSTKGHRVNSAESLTDSEMREAIREYSLDDLFPDEPQTYDEAVERVHRAFCFPDEQVGEWDRSMADALRRNGYRIEKVRAPDEGAA